MNTVRERIPEMLAPAPVPQGEPERAGPIRMSCVIPCRNEARNLDLLLPQLCDLLPRLAEAWEVILVDDGSTDHTATVMRDWSELPGFRVLELSRNFGKEAALTAGLEAAAGDVVVMMDADLQHPPALVSEMLGHWRRGARRRPRRSPPASARPARE